MAAQSTYSGNCKCPVVCPPFPRLRPQPDADQKAGPDEGQDDGARHDDEAALVIVCDEVGRRDDAGRRHGGECGVENCSSATRTEPYDDEKRET